MQILNWIGSIFGYLLWFCFEFTKNYGIALVLFTLVIKAIFFPLSIKQQKSMAQSARLSGKQKELQQKYGNDKAKMNEELQKLYQKEGVNPMGGCLPTILPLFLLMCVYYAVVNPLQNTLHIAYSKIQEALNLMTQLPGVGGAFGSGYYGELEIVRHFPSLKDSLTMFTPEELSNIQMFHDGFNVLGLDLLGTPSTAPFNSFLWLIPVLCLVSSLVTQFFTMKMQGNAQQTQGCMKVMLIVMPLFSAYIAYSVPAAVGAYWIVNTVLSFVQTFVMMKYYNADLMTAREETARIALRAQEEASLKRFEVPLQLQPGRQEKSGEKQQKQGGQQSGKKKKKSNSGGSDYMGSKKNG